jgi:hypothetical protein
MLTRHASRIRTQYLVQSIFDTFFVGADEGSGGCARGDETEDWGEPTQDDDAKSKRCACSRSHATERAWRKGTLKVSD